MNGEEDILKTIIEKESWEEIIYYIVSLENLNPWDVDLVKLTERFIKFVQSVQDLDFKIPAKVVFISGCNLVCYDFNEKEKKSNSQFLILNFVRVLIFPRGSH